MPYAIQSLTPLLISIALFFLVPVIFRSLRSGKSTGMFIDTSLYSLSIFRTFYLIQYTRAFLALNKAGVQVLETLRFSASAVDNRYFRKNTASFKDSIARGNTLADTLNQEIFPLDFRQIVSSGEISGKLDFSLEKYLENLEFTFKHRLKILAKLSSVILYILIICVLGFSVISKYIKYFGVK